MEVSRLRINHINRSDSGYIVEVFRKGEEVGGQLVGLTHKAIDPIIDDYLPFRGVACDDEFVFLTHSTTGERQMTPDRIGRIVKSYMVKSGIYSRQKTSHSLRHTAQWWHYSMVPISKRSNKCLDIVGSKRQKSI